MPNKSNHRRRPNPKSSSRPKSFEKKDSERSSFTKDSSVVGKENDPSWYAYNQSIMDASANLYYSTPLGVRVNLQDPNHSVLNGVNFPGVMTINYCPTPGSSGGVEALINNESTPVNVAAQSIYSFVRHANSGSKNYEAADLMMYLLAMDSLYILYAEAKRIYGLARNNSISNRYYPRGIITALGWNAEDVMTNLAQMESMVDNMAYILGSLPIPNNMHYYTRHIWMSSNLWVDSVGIKPQTYAFRIDGIWEWSGFTSTTGTEMHWKTWYELFPAGATVAEFWNVFSSLVNDYLADEDIGIITGDIKKAFGAENLLQLTTIDRNYTVYPMYSDEVVSQIQNLVILGQPADSIRQVSGIILTPDLFIPETTTEGNTGGFLNIRKDNPTASDTMVATRLAAICEVYTDPDMGAYNRCASYGSEIVTSVIMWAPDTLIDDPVGSAIKPVPTPLRTRHILPTTNDATLLKNYINGLFGVIAMTTKFDWHPFGYVVDANNVIHYVFGDVDNFTTYSVEDLKAMNRTALLSQLLTPAMGVFNPAYRM